MLKRILISFMFFFVSSYGYTAELPKKCQPIGVQADTLVIDSRLTNLIFIHNIGDTDLYLTHVPDKDPGADAGWTTRLNQKKWSVLKIDKDKMAFQCVAYRPGHEQQVSCQGLLAVCQIQPVSVPKHHVGSFWVDENQTLSKVLETVSSRGFNIIATEE